ncbi:thiamine pyrophosphate-binding protein [Caulobacter segnis]
MIDAPRFLRVLDRRGVGLYAGVPDSALKALGRALAERIEAPQHIVAANEGSAMGLAAGHHLATGGLACVYMQNSGLGHAANPLASLFSVDVYAIPVLLIIGWRGEIFDGVQLADEPQHAQRGRDHLADARLPGASRRRPWSRTRRSPGRRHGQGPDRPECRPLRARSPCRASGRSRRGSDPSPEASPYSMSREQALQEAMAALPLDAIYVATTGKTSREAL